MYTVAESAKMCLNALTCIIMHITQKGNKLPNMVKIGQNGRKLQIITKYQKLLNYGYKITKMTNKWPKWAKEQVKWGQI